MDDDNIMSKENPSLIQLRRTLMQPPDDVNSLAWSPDGRTLAVGTNDGLVQLWDAESGKLKHKLKKHLGPIVIVVWSPDGRLVASGGDDNAVHIWNAESGTVEVTLKKHKYIPSAMAWSPDGRTLASGAYNGNIRLWNTISGKLRRALPGPRGTVQQIAWSSDGITLASVADDNIIYLWNVKTTRIIRSIGEQRRPSRASNFISDSWFSVFDRMRPQRLATDWYIRQVLELDNEVESALDYKSKLDQLLDDYKSRSLSLIIDPPYAKKNSEISKDIDQYWDKITGAKTQFSNVSGEPIKHYVEIGNFESLNYVNNIEKLQETPRKKTEEDRQGTILSLAFSPTNSLIASGADDAIIRIWDPNTGLLIQSLEGHTASVTTVSWTSDGRLLLSSSPDGTLRLWRCDTWETIKIIDNESPEFVTFSVSIHSPQPVLTALSEGDIQVRTWELNIESLLSIPSGIATIHFASAKIVLVGESNVGKSCLALRLTKDDYQEQGTTHGMRIWSMSPEELVPELPTYAEQNREVILWDMGGQDEYRLVHQLFLHDTTLALILLDPTRGRTAFEEVEGWNLRLEKQLHGRKTVKILVGTKLDSDADERNEIIDYASLDKLTKECNLDGYYSTSAKTNRGIAELRRAIYEGINWEMLSKTSRPVLFQRIRDEIEKRQKNGEVVLLYSELEESIRSEVPEQFDRKAVDIVIEQLSLQGVVIGTRLASGQRVLVLQISEIERYAGSVIIAARNNPRGVPAIEEQMITTAKLSFPGIKKEKRLHPFQERIVLECVVQLLIEHGICLRHEGLLIFPTLFQPTGGGEAVSFSHSVSLYYDFSGAIDNIYSSLVIRLAMSEQFGRVRLWEDRAEFERAGQGICGLRKVLRRRGFAHLDLFFSDQVQSHIRDLFTVFIEEHLRKEGVNITEVLEVKCACGYLFQESSLRKRLSEGYEDIICPECEIRSHISEGAQKARSTSLKIERNLLALKTIINQKREETLVEVKMAFKEGSQQSLNDQLIRILHLSDLHLTPEDDSTSRLQPLVRDLVDKKGGLGIERLDYLVISGDLTNHATPEEFERAYLLISRLIEYFKLTAERCILVPGNHDLSWDEPVYEWKQERLVNTDTLKEGSFVEQGKGFLLLMENRYPQRFLNFAKFYHELKQQEYPLKLEEQCIPLLFEENKIQFINLNSAWEIDEFFKDRSSINSSAISRGLSAADNQIKKAVESKRLKRDDNVLRIAVMHHPVTGNEKIVNDAFLGRLRREDVKLCLHGHIHEERTDLIGHYLPNRKIHTIGAGTFGAPAKARPESTPRLYNLLEISHDNTKIRIHTRGMRKESGAWEGYAIWPTQDPTQYKTYYDIELSYD
jgi:small GTP-binding protein